MAMPPANAASEEAEVSDRPEDVDAAFAEIVAGLQREGVGRDVRDDNTDQKQQVEDQHDDQPVDADRATTWRGHDTELDWTWSSDDDHYVPPEPPPLPRLRPMTILALVLVASSVLLLFIPGLVGLDARVATPIALVALVGGFGMLLLRLRRSPADADDDGAQV